MTDIELFKEGYAKINCLVNLSRDMITMAQENFDYSEDNLWPYSLSYWNSLNCE